jgi:hypothetical protein
MWLSPLGGRTPERRMLSRHQMGMGMETINAAEVAAEGVD